MGLTVSITHARGPVAAVYTRDGLPRRLLTHPSTPRAAFFPQGGRKVSSSRSEVSRPSNLSKKKKRSKSYSVALREHPACPQQAPSAPDPVAAADQPSLPRCRGSKRGPSAFSRQGLPCVQQVARLEGPGFPPHQLRTPSCCWLLYPRGQRRGMGREKGAEGAGSSEEGTLLSARRRQHVPFGHTRRTRWVSRPRPRRRNTSVMAKPTVSERFQSLPHEQTRSIWSSSLLHRRSLPSPTCCSSANRASESIRARKIRVSPVIAASAHQLPSQAFYSPT